MTDSSMTGSALLASAAKTVLAPRLRSVGFRGGPRAFAKSYPEVWLSLTLNTMSGVDGSSFTADIGISSKLLLGGHGADSRKPPPRHAWHHEQRMGSLVGRGFDRWWTIDSGMSEDEAIEVVGDFANVLVGEAIPGLATVMSNQGLLERWRADAAYLSPPEVGNLHDLERVLGLEPTPIPRRNRPDIAGDLAAVVLGIAAVANAAKHARGESGDVRVSVSDPNGALREALATDDRDALVRILTSSPWKLDRHELTAALEDVSVDASSPESKPTTSEQVLKRLFNIRSRRMANDKNRRSARKPPEAR